MLTFQEPPDFDQPGDLGRDNKYDVTVVATDGDRLPSRLEVTVMVTDVNEGPIITSQAEFTVFEIHDQILFTYTAQDPDLEITRWSVTGTDGGDFTINGAGELSFRNNPDYERPADSNRNNEYLVTVRASDGRYYGSFTVTVIVDPVIEPPDITGDDTITYRENDRRDMETYRATDPEGTGTAWLLFGDDFDDFEISGRGVLTFKDPPDYENPTDLNRDNVYMSVVEKWDEDLEIGRFEVTVTVTNLTHNGPTARCITTASSGGWS